MNKIQFMVFGKPKAQPRPRAFSRGGHARIYEAGTAEAWKSDVIRCGEACKPNAPIEEMLSVSIDFFLPRPKRLMRRKDPDGIMFAPVKPDRDNLDKAVLDALTNVGWWRDDCQVVCGEVRKFYHEKEGRPGALITISAPPSL